MYVGHEGLDTGYNIDLDILFGSWLSIDLWPLWLLTVIPIILAIALPKPEYPVS